jgi:hypothetical protein
MLPCIGEQHVLHKGQAGGGAFDVGEDDLGHGWILLWKGLAAEARRRRERQLDRINRIHMISECPKPVVI